MSTKRKRTLPTGKGLQEESPTQADVTATANHQDGSPKKRTAQRADILSTPTAQRTLPINLSKNILVTPSKVTTPQRNAVDRSAKRKSNQRRIERVVAAEETEDEEDEDERIADEIADGTIEVGGDNDDEEEEAEHAEQAAESVEPDGGSPVKRGRGRPKGSKNREITPPTDLPAHEWYFWINRPNGLNTSTNTFPATAFLDHSAYYETLQAYQDPHAECMRKLQQHHVVDFDFWKETLLEGYNIILHGLGNKSGLLKNWADWIHAKHDTEHTKEPATPSKSFKKGKRATSRVVDGESDNVAPPITIVLDAHHPALTTRMLFSTIANAALPTELARTMPNQATDSVKFLLEHLTLTSSTDSPHIYLLVNPIHAPVLAHSPMPTLLAELSQHPRMHIIATADDPHFPLLWSQGLRDQYNWVFCDGATFATYDDGKGQIAGVGVVDTVNELLGRKGARGKGREGVRWVLRSLPENARQVYRILVAEILSAESDGGVDMEVEMDEIMPEDPDEEMAGLDDDGFGAADGRSRNRRPRPGEDELPAISYKMLYSKAVEEFLTSSEMGFRGLLKEFVDHQMVVIQRDMSGQEAIGIDMRRDELTGVLEDLLLTE